MSHATMPQPKLKRIGKDKWRVEEDFTYITVNGKRTIIKQGFETDGASSPFRKLITSMGGHYPVEAVAHDWFYTKMNEGRPDPAAPTRKAADRNLRLGMKRAGVKPLVRIGMWFAVRALGGPGLKGLGVR